MVVTKQQQQQQVEILRRRRGFFIEELPKLLEASFAFEEVEEVGVGVVTGSSGAPLRRIIVQKYNGKVME